MLEVIATGVGMADINDQLKKMQEARERLKAQLDESSDSLEAADNTLKEMQKRQQARMRADNRMRDTALADQLRRVQSSPHDNHDVDIDKDVEIEIPADDDADKS